MNDKVFKKQLETLGIEEIVLVEGDLNKKHKVEFADINRGVVEALMNSMEGRQWMYSKLEMCGVFTAPWAGEQPLTNAFLSGIQSVGQSLLADAMAASPNNFFLMVEEDSARKLNKK